MLKSVTLALLVLFLAPLAMGQLIHPVAYPQNTTTESSGNLVPLGFSSSSGNFDEGRYQILIPATHLPSSGAQIVGIEVNSQVFSGTVIYETLNMNLSHTTAATLSSALTTNLPSPHPALAGSNLAVSYISRSWEPILFSAPFTYNGTDNLVLDIQKVYDRLTNPVSGLVTMETNGNGVRQDLPIAQATFGTYGSGAAFGTSARYSYTSFMKVRLLVLDIPTLVIESAAIPDPSGRNKTFLTGGNVSLTVNAFAGSIYTTWFELAWIPPVSVPPVRGALILSPINTLHGATVPASGSDVLSFPIPNMRSLVGGHVMLQSLVLEPSSTMTFTCGVDAIIQ